MNGNNARAACQNIGADLAMIKTEARNREVDQLYRSKRDRFDAYDNLWIGLTRKDTNNGSKDPSNWVWVDGTDASSYTNWASGEPNDYIRNEDCVHMGHEWTGVMYEWNDHNCDSWLASVLCEVEANPLGTLKSFILITWCIFAEFFNLITIFQCKLSIRHTK
jgi:hypothetical protein